MSSLKKDFFCLICFTNAHYFSYAILSFASIDEAQRSAYLSESFLVIEKKVHNANCFRNATVVLRYLHVTGVRFTIRILQFAINVFCA